MAAVVTLEHTRMRPGEVAAALLAWTQAVVPGTSGRISPTCVCPECSGTEPRGRLERALNALPVRARRSLYALLLPVDRRFLALTCPDAYASPEWPWWERRTSLSLPRL